MIGGTREPADLAVRWFTVLWGIGAVIVGTLLISTPVVTALFLVQVMALLWLIGSVVDLNVDSLQSCG